MALRDHALLRRLVSFARSSPWLMIAIGLHVILAAVMSLAYIRHERQEEDEGPGQIAVGHHAREVEPLVPLEVKIDRQAIPELDSRAELVAIEDVETFVPTEELPEEVDWHEPLGDPTGSDEESSSTGGTSIGVGQGGHYGTGRPSTILRKRVSDESGRRKGRNLAGIPVGTEEAVLEGLRWLMRHQNEDGSWSAPTLHGHCTEPACVPADPALDPSFDVGLTALSLLAFLGQGLSPLSKVEIVDESMGRPPRRAGDVVKKGIRWLMDQQKPDGSFSGSAPFALPENDTLPTMALCEAYGLAPSLREVKRSAQKALDFLVAAQKRAPQGWLDPPQGLPDPPQGLPDPKGGSPMQKGGWGAGSQRDLDLRHELGELDDEAYAEACQDVDLSITCWVVMALASAKSCGFAVPDEALAGALAYGVDATEGALAGDAAVRVDPEDRFEYHATRRAALGMCLRTFAGGSIDDPFLENAARELAADVPRVSKDRLSVDFYYWYFATLALNQYDGPDSPRAGPRRGEFWEPWEKGLVDSLLGLQDLTRKKDVCSRGGWLQEARGNRRGRALYNTALNVLTLEVYYRFANVFGSVGHGSDGGGK